MGTNLFQLGDEIVLGQPRWWKRAFHAAWKFLMPKHWRRHNVLTVTKVDPESNSITISN